MAKQFVVGIDIGGQTSKIGVVDARGDVLYQSAIRTDTFGDDADAYIAALADAVKTCVLQAGMTMDDIAYHLNRECRLTRKGNPWNKFNLRTVLHNPVYAGYLRWEEIRQRHDAEPVVTVEEFNEVQMMFASKIRDPKKRNPELLCVS